MLNNEQSDPARVAGAAVHTIELGGKTYNLKPWTMGVYAEMSAFVRSLKGDPIQELCNRLSSLPSDQHAKWMRAAVEAAANQTPTDEEMTRFEESNLGAAFKLWTLLKTDHLAEFPTPFAVMNMMTNLSEAKLMEVAAKAPIASGENDLKNSAGQPGTGP